MSERGLIAAAVVAAAMVLPADAELEVASGNAFTKVLIDGVDLGTRAWAPFVWKVPSGLTGKGRRLTVLVTTSMLPVFGDPQAAGAKWKREFYQPPRTGETDPGLLSVSLRPREDAIQ